jgi:hypothetical protein
MVRGSHPSPKHAKDGAPLVILFQQSVGPPALDSVNHPAFPRNAAAALASYGI